MVRISKKAERRATCPKKRRVPSKKTGPKKEQSSFKEHQNAVTGNLAAQMFIPIFQ